MSTPLPTPSNETPWPKVKLVGHSWSDSSIYTEDGKYLCGSSIEGDATEDTQEELEAEQTETLTRFCDVWNLLAPHPDLSAIEIHSKEKMDEVREALRGIAKANPRQWDESVQDQFESWAKSIASGALNKILP